MRRAGARDALQLRVAGVFVDQIGRIGQGPGEYTEPRLIELAPDGRIFVWDPSQRRVVVFAADATACSSAAGKRCGHFLGHRRADELVDRAPLSPDVTSAISTG